MPDGLVSTGYPAVQAKCRDLGIEHDDWQQGLGRLALGKRADGKYAATVGGVVISIPRQVGKTYTIGSIIFALCIIFPRLTVLWTTHHTATTDETFGSMYGLSHRKRIAPHIAARRRANGQQRIVFRNGSRILFGAREQGFGRGFSEVDVEVFDEAQILTQRALEDMVAATNQSKHPAGALLFYMGTPPRPIDPGEAFTAKRTRALSGDAKNVVYVEMSADPDADPDDRQQWAKANPSYPQRTPEESMLRLRENVGSDESFLREGLGIWPVAATADAFRAVWPDLADPGSGIADRPFLAVSMTPDRSTVSLVAAGKRPDGQFHVETVLHGRAGTWFVEKTVEIARRQGSEVGLVPSHPAGSLLPALEESKIRLRTLTAGEYTQSCGAFYDAVTGGTVHYLPPQPELADAVSRATRKQSGMTWRWAGDDISALVAASQAYFMALSFVPVGSGRAVALS
ncbi:MAG: hypothetical protein JO222_00890 [Frankiales bacterium]|nr:hypothetical protein [Frankiales bacterium]